MRFPFGISFKQEKNKELMIPDNLFSLIEASLKKLPNSLAQLSTIGWYMTGYMTPAEINYLSDEIELKNYDLVDNFMVEHIQKNKELIFRNLLSRLPERINVIQSGINAHLKRDYYASIPIFLSQADGICIQLTGFKLYAKEARKPKVSHYVKKLKEGSFSSIMLQPLTINNALNSSEKDSKLYNGLLNRNEVLHGISINYGTEINGCKSLSILNFVGESLWKSK